jgi:hypothetical protein
MYLYMSFYNLEVDGDSPLAKLDSTEYTSNHEADTSESQSKV